MAEKSALIQSFVLTIKEAVFYNIDRLNQLRCKDFPFKASEEFIAVLSKIHEGLLEILDALESTVLGNAVKSDKPIPPDLLKRISRFGHLVGVLHSMLRILEMGSREYISEGTVVLMESITQKFCPNTHFILLPLDEYNFSYEELTQPLKTMLRDVLPQIDEIMSPLARKFVVIGFPLVQKENVLLNSLLAHEIGHFINEEKEIVRNLMEKVTVDPKKVDEISKEWSKFTAGKEVIELTRFIELARIQAEVHKMATRWISNWLKELASDILAFHIIGPSYLFALTNFLLTLIDIDEESDEYPPPRMRIKLLLDEFDEMGYSKILKSAKMKNRTAREMAEQYASLSGLLCNFLSEIEEREKDKFSALVHESVENVIPDLRNKVHEVVGRKGYTPKKFLKEVFSLILTLDSFVPPAEISAEEPASPYSIINGGMLYKMLLLKNFYTLLKAKTSKDKLYAIHKLHQLVSKALELSNIEYLMKRMSICEKGKQQSGSHE